MSGGIDSLTERIIILPEAKMDYMPKQIKRFIEMWNEGYHIGDIAEKLWVTNYEAALVVMHCELEEWIQPREGGLYGTIPRKSRYVKKALRGEKK
jgi:hypothetical protein